MEKLVKIVRGSLGIAHKTRYPQELKIAGIDTLIVDPHNEAFTQWEKSRKKPAILLHIDLHGDMGDDMATVETVEGWGVAKKNYAISLGQGHFIVAAVHYGIVGAIYHFDPRKDFILAYGRLNNGSIVYTPATKEVNGMIKWASQNIPIPEAIAIPQFLEQTGSTLPWVLDLDLDALLCSYAPQDYDMPEALYKQRLEKINALLAFLPKPEAITIARSQSPEAYCPPDKVNMLQAESIKCFYRLYKNR